MSDQLVAEAATCTTQDKHNRRTSTPSTGFEPAIPALKFPYNCALGRTGTGIGEISEMYVIMSEPNCYTAYQFLVALVGDFVLSLINNTLSHGSNTARLMQNFTPQTLNLFITSGTFLP
jgi:hypothetical protein